MVNLVFHVIDLRGEVFDDHAHVRYYIVVVVCQRLEFPVDVVLEVLLDRTSGASERRSNQFLDPFRASAAVGSFPDVTGEEGVQDVIDLGVNVVAGVLRRHVDLTVEFIRHLIC